MAKFQWQSSLWDRGAQPSHQNLSQEGKVWGLRAFPAFLTAQRSGLGPPPVGAHAGVPAVPH